MTLDIIDYLYFLYYFMIGFYQKEIISFKALEAWSEYLFSISKIQSHNFTEIKYLHSCQNETLSKYQESKLEFFDKIHRTLDSKEILSSDWSWGSFQTLYILLQISWKLQTENCVSSREREEEEIWRRSKLGEEQQHQ